MKRALSVVGFALGLIFLLLAVSHVRWDTFLAAIASLQPGWVILSVSALLGAMFLRSVRWFLVIGLRRADLRKVWEAACIGYLGNAIYPARAGEVLRMLRLKQLTGAGGGLAIGSVVVDRILDGLALCCLLLVLLLAWGGKLQAQQGLRTIAFVFLAAAGGMVLFVVSGYRLRRVFQWLGTLGRIGVRLNRWYEESLAGLQILRSPRRLLLAGALQILVTLFDLTACWLLFRAFGWGLPPLAAVVVLTYLAAAVSLPSTPGYIGVYQVAALFALRPFDMNDSAAVAYGTVLQVQTLLLFVGVGGWAYLRGKAATRYRVENA